MSERGEQPERRTPQGSGTSPAALRRMGIVAAVLTVLAAADALYMQLSGYHAEDVNNFHLSDAGTVFVAAALLLVLTVLLFVLSARADRKPGGDAAEGRGR